MTGCPSDPEATDAGSVDGAVDANVGDAGPTDGGSDGGTDGGTDAGNDAGADAGLMDAGLMDAGNDAGSDAGPTHCVPSSGTTLATQVVARGLNNPVFVGAPTGDARLFIVEQAGVIQLVVDGDVQDTPFLDIRSRVESGGNEQGLLGLAFHPDYATNGRFFVHYSERRSGDTIIAEYGAADGADVAAMDERRILEISQPYSNHNGGMIAFSPNDGYLYIGMGDGGSGGDPDGYGQDNTTLLGSMLRLDIDGDAPYAIPSDNPYADSANGADDPRPETWAYGLRNPWRFSFDATSGDMYIGDVGQNRLEEIDFQSAGSVGGENYGWNTMEGNSCYPRGDSCDRDGLEPPIAEYDHSGGSCSVTGGYIYRGSCLTDIQGLYFYADICSNRMWTMDRDNDAEPVLRDEFLASSISSFGEDGFGELYVISLNGTVYKVVVE